MNRGLIQRTLRLACLMTCSIVGNGCDSGGKGGVSSSERFPQDGADKLIVAQDKNAATIQREIAGSETEHPWAGIYAVNGTDTSQSLAIAPDAGFVRTASGLNGKRVLASGEVSFDNGKLCFGPIRGSLDSDSSMFPDCLYVVPWGGRRYLLDENDIVDFCNSVNSGAEARFPSSVFWIDHREALVEGLPTLPPQYMSFVLPAPVIAHIVKKLDRVFTDESGRRWGMLALDVGRTQGVFERMLLYRSSSGKDACGIRVVEIRDSESNAVCDPMNYPSIEEGDSFSTARVAN